jgi:hypothetical protein
MAERAEFLRLQKQGDMNLNRAMDQDQFSQPSSALDFYIQVSHYFFLYFPIYAFLLHIFCIEAANCYNKALYIPIPDGDKFVHFCLSFSRSRTAFRDAETERITKGMHGRMESAIKRVNQILDANPERFSPAVTSLHSSFPARLRSL